MTTYSELGENDLDAYYHVLHAGYQTDKKYPISFSAITATKEQEREWLAKNPTYGLFEGHVLVSAVSLRMPWGPNPGPEGVPHIGQVVTAPEHMHKGYASKLINLVLEEVLKKQLKVPFVTLGTATSHPWLRRMYEKLGFRAFREVQLPGKQHRTVYLRKDLI